MTLRSLAISARYLSREECEAMAKRALSFSTADETRVLINSTSIANTRFAVNQISTGGDSFDSVVTVIAKFGKRSGSSSTNQLDDEAVIDKGLRDTDEFSIAAHCGSLSDRPAVRCQTGWAGR